MSESPVSVSVLPEVIREREQWVCWREEKREGKPTKIPVMPGTGRFASSTDPETWGEFEQALEYAETEYADGVGFVFTDDDPIVGVDLDDCRDPETGEANDAARDIIDRLDSYTEVSPSGTGFHVLIRGELPDGRNRRGSVELYDTARFFTVTGDHVADTPSRIARRQDALTAVHREYVQDTETNTDSDSGHRDAADERSATTRPVDVESDLEDEELLEKARNASNGSKFDRLWNGSTAGYDSQSEADMALSCLLAFWTGGDQTQADRLFRRSGLLREKWDEVHYADGSTYGEKTIERAVATTSEFYEPTGDDDTADERKSTTNASSDVDGDDSQPSRAYLVEKNQLLTDRVDELEATVTEKRDRIDTLEAEIEQLTEALDRRDQDREESHDAAAVNTGERGGESETSSVWGRTKRLFGNSE
ncbi:hypothetical protein [Haloarchaeobius sp. FL176]|uniref:phage NrS-1 polymerase family protein n=1 Tax=Haloarchaeobius sp. FL176 TaxID=2967129 RepID=UPI0021488C0B|nr:hypothetical protein [Haloarchaeobius sp. FL176]